MFTDSVVVMFQKVQALALESQELALASLDYSRPFVSGMGFVFKKEEGEFGRFSVILSDFSQHGKNIARNSEVSLLLMEQKSIPTHEKQKVTFICTTNLLDEAKDAKWLQRYKDAYLQKYPTSKDLFQLPDVHFYEFIPFEIRWVIGNGKYQVFVLRSRRWMQRTDVNETQANREAGM
ncbi:MAG TPA: pyridoxamine 5'-phosphate oxidase family protein [Candidatus Omnitrophota bacterium]|nr:pyridoxamine 5'-phosphate oxidase family protein [Candidatus Omnitrophota bacterium]